MGAIRYLGFPLSEKVFSLPFTLTTRGRKPKLKPAVELHPFCFLADLPKPGSPTTGLRGWGVRTGVPANDPYPRDVANSHRISFRKAMNPITYHWQYLPILLQV